MNRQIGGATHAGREIGRGHHTETPGRRALMNITAYIVLGILFTIGCVGVLAPQRDRGVHCVS